jgi:chromosome segregation ATPase
VLGRRKRTEAENELLRMEVARLAGLDPSQIADEVSSTEAQLAELKARQIEALEVLSRARAEADAIRTEIIQLRDEQLLQDVGIYEGCGLTSVTHQASHVARRLADAMTRSVGVASRRAVMPMPQRKPNPTAMSSAAPNAAECMSSWPTCGKV